MSYQYKYLTGDNGEYNYINLNFFNSDFQNGFMIINYNATSPTPYEGLGDVITAYPVTYDPKIFIIDRENKITIIRLTAVKGIVGNGSVGDTGNQFVITGTSCQPATFYAIKNNLYVAGFNLEVSTIPTTSATAVFTVSEYYIYQIDIVTQITTLITSSTTNVGYKFVGSYQDLYLFYTDNAYFYQLNTLTGAVTTIDSTTQAYYAYVNLIDLSAISSNPTAVIITPPLVTPQSLIFLNPVSLAAITGQIDLPSYTNAITVESMIVDIKKKILYIYDSANTQLILYNLTTKIFSNILL